MKIRAVGETDCDRPGPICSTGKGFGLFGPLSVTDTMVRAMALTDMMVLAATFTDMMELTVTELLT